MTGSIKAYTPNFDFIIPEFNITGWHDYLEENFRSIDALLYNLFEINNYSGVWKKLTSYTVGQVLFIGDTGNYSGRLVKVLVDHTTTNDDFTTFYTNNPTYYELFADASDAQIYAQEARDWAIKTDGPVEGSNYSSKYYAEIVNSISKEINSLYAMRNDLQTLANISTDISNVADNSTNINTVSSNINNVNSVATNISDINNVKNNLTTITAVNNNKTNINTVANNINGVNSVATDINNINNVADDLTNIDAVVTNETNINKVAINISNVNNVGTNISNVNTTANNIRAISNVSSDLILGSNSIIKKVADNMNDINLLAGIDDDITTVSNISSDVTTVSGISADVTAVKNNATNINAVNSNKTNIDIVANISNDVSTVANNNTNINTVVNNLTAINNAPTYANNSKIWAEGLDGEVTPLGGTHSSKGWAQIAEQAASGVQNPANRDLSNLTSDGQMVIDSQNGTISNCVLEIPQNIKVTLENNVLTLKSGSILTLTGSTYSTYTLTSDVSMTIPNTLSDGLYMPTYTAGGGMHSLRSLSIITSGSSLPENPSNGDVFFNTTDKKIYIYSTSWSEWNVTYPFCVIEMKSGVASFVKFSDGRDCIFNGIGFVGQTKFIYPNFKVLQPIGKNADGTLKSREFTTNSLQLSTSGGTYNRRMFLNNTTFQITANNWYYDEETNYYYNQENTPFITGCIELGNCFTVNDIVTDFTVRQPVKLVSTEVTDKIQSQVNTNTTTIATKADDNNVVKLTGNQTIAGVKTFSNTVNVNNPNTNDYILVQGKLKDTDITSNNPVNGHSDIRFLDKNNVFAGGFFYTVQSTGKKYVEMRIKKKDLSNISLELGEDASGNTYTSVPTPTEDTTSSNQIDTVGARNIKLQNIIETLYPIGSVYIGTQSTCPLATLIPNSTWELVAQDKALWTSNGTNANTTINAGLPNITATGGSYMSGLNGTDASSGAISRTLGSGTGYRLDTGGGNYFNETFDASQSNAIYGNSTTVQPPAYVVNVWRRTA